MMPHYALVMEHAKFSPGQKSKQPVLAAVLVAALAGCRPPTPVAPTDEIAPRQAQTANSVDDLLALMRDRLLLMHDVARWKWNERLPIADPEREQQLLSDLAERGLVYGLDPEQTTRFMAAQIEAGKLVQQADFDAWKRRGTDKFPNARDLKADLRPRIDELSGRLLAELAKLNSAANSMSAAQIEQRAREILSGEGIDDDVRRTALRPLLASHR